MQCWRVSVFKLLRSKNKDQKHLSLWLRKHSSNPSSDLCLLDTCSAISWQVWSVPTHCPARHWLIRGGGKQHVSLVCIRSDALNGGRIFRKTRMLTIIPKCFLCVRNNHSKYHRSLAFEGSICFWFCSKSLLWGRFFQPSEQQKTAQTCCRRHQSPEWIAFLLWVSWINISHLSPVAEVDGNTYWRNPFNSLCNPRQLEEFIVMDIDIIRDQKLGAGAGMRSSRVCMSANSHVSACKSKFILC